MRTHICSSFGPAHLTIAIWNRYSVAENLDGVLIINFVDRKKLSDLGYKKDMLAVPTVREHPLQSHTPLYIFKLGPICFHAATKKSNAKRSVKLYTKYELYRTDFAADNPLV